MSKAEGYSVRERSEREIAIFQHGKLAVILRDKKAEELKAALADTANEQQTIADFVGANGQAARGVANASKGGALAGGTSGAHGHKEFRRKSGG